MSNKVEPTMRYRPDRVTGATPSQKEPVYYYKVFEGEEVESCLEDGWYAHPSDFPKKKTNKETKSKKKVK